MVVPGPASEPALPGAVPPTVDTEDRRLYVNRELSLLAFQWRVLEEARDPQNPLLERTKFLGIVASNLDEFFMVRVSGLERQNAAGVAELPPDGLTPAEQLAAVRTEAVHLMQAMRTCLATELTPALAKAGVHLLDYAQLTRAERAEARRHFREIVFPVLTPLANDSGRPFPHISNLSLNLALLVRDAEGRERFARLKVPGTLPRFLALGAERGTKVREHRLVWLEQVIAAHVGELFPGMTVAGRHLFHVTRDADLAMRELEADDLLETIEESVRKRRFRAVVRLVVNPETPAAVRELLVRNLEIADDAVSTVAGPLALGALRSLHALDRYDLKYPPHLPSMPAPFRKSSGNATVFTAIRKSDVLVHHPYDSFAPVVEFVTRAARDRRVLAIKQTLYRAGSDSPVVEALLEAPSYGKEVAALVELKARFDEESNIEWARALEREGVHVIYGLVGLKTHCKALLVVRKEGKRIRRYVHLATGNYNAVTAQHYTDLGFFSCDEAIGADVTDLFNYLTGYSAKTGFRKLLVAPINLRARLEELVRREIDRQRAGEPAHLIFKMNALADKRMIQLLYEASRAGVHIDLIVRGICCLRPGLPGVSENIRVTSIVGRFLEHSRVYYFLNGGEEQVYLGSADLMSRNLDRRVEVLFPVEVAGLVRQLRDEVLGVELADNVKARRMRPDGSYERVVPLSDEARIDAQAVFLRLREAGWKGAGAEPV